MILADGSAISSTTLGIGGVLLSSIATIGVAVVTYLGKKAEERRQEEGPDAVAGFTSLSAEQQRERQYLRDELDRVRGELKDTRSQLADEQRHSRQLEMQVNRLTSEMDYLNHRLRRLEGPAVP